MTSFYPDNPLKWLLLQAAFLGPLDEPWTLHIIGVLGRGQSCTPSGPPAGLGWADMAVMGTSLPWGVGQGTHL